MILNVPFIFNRDDFNKRVRIELYEGMEDEIESLLKKAVPLINPKAIFLECSIDEITDNFTDEILLNRLNSVENTYPYIVTCGLELDVLADEFGDMLVNFWLDALKQMAMDTAFNYFRSYIKHQYNIKKLYSINPGSDACGEGWAFEDQKILFTLFPDVTRDIGVTLTDSLLMNPNKTVSGIIFESDRDFISCQECDNIHCSNRKMIHEGAVITND